MKPGRPCLTISTQEPEALKVLAKSASEKNSELIIVDPLETLAFPNNSRNFWSINASLALEAVKLFLKETDIRLKDLNVISHLNLHGMQQVVSLSGCVRLFLDCAHTRESIASTASWFKDHSPMENTRLLLFTLTGARDPFPMVKEDFVSCNFSAVYISKLDESKSILKRPASKEAAHQRCVDAWTSLSPDTPVSCVLSGKEFIDQVLNRATDLKDSSSCKNVDVLVTGSVYLVGNVLSHLQTLNLFDDH